MAESIAIYQSSATLADQPLRQGEIVSNIVRARLSSISLGSPQSFMDEIHPYAIIITQDCDLAQDFHSRQSPSAINRTIPNILFCEVTTATDLFGKLGGKQKEWEREKIDKNKNERYHFLQRIDANADTEQTGIEELGIDFKRYFTIPTDEVYERIRIGQAKRRTILASPYLEHFSCRFAYYLSRIGLPTDHITE